MGSISKPQAMYLGFCMQVASFAPTVGLRRKVPEPLLELPDPVLPPVPLPPADPLVTFWPSVCASPFLVILISRKHPVASATSTKQTAKPFKFLTFTPDGPQGVGKQGSFHEIPMED